jgi:hypothetical protein
MPLSTIFGTGVGRLDCGRSIWAAAIPAGLRSGAALCAVGCAAGGGEALFSNEADDETFEDFSFSAHSAEMGRHVKTRQTNTNPTADILRIMVHLLIRIHSCIIPALHEAQQFFPFWPSFFSFAEKRGTPEIRYPFCTNQSASVHWQLPHS